MHPWRRVGLLMMFCSFSLTLLFCLRWFFIVWKEKCTKAAKRKKSTAPGTQVKRCLIVSSDAFDCVSDNEIFSRTFVNSMRQIGIKDMPLEMKWLDHIPTIHHAPFPRFLWQNIWYKRWKSTYSRNGIVVDVPVMDLRLKIGVYLTSIHGGLVRNHHFSFEDNPVGFVLCLEKNWQENCESLTRSLTRVGVWGSRWGGCNKNAQSPQTKGGTPASLSLFLLLFLLTSHFHSLSRPVAHVQRHE